MNFGRRTILTMGLLGTTLVGGVLGVTVFAPGVSSAQSTSTSTTAAPSGTFKPNEDEHRSLHRPLSGPRLEPAKNALPARDTVVVDATVREQEGNPRREA